jgi:hypothetical protein
MGAKIGPAALDCQCALFGPPGLVAQGDDPSEANARPFFIADLKSQ